MSDCLQKRNLFAMAGLLIITLGFYFIYWAVVTKRALRCRGADMPTAWLLIIPLVHFYFWFRFAKAFTAIIKHGNDYIGYFLLMALLPHVGMFVIQHELNQIAD
jgi:hypothetical protein